MCSLPKIGWFPTSESNPKMVSDEAVVVLTETIHSSGKSSSTDKRYDVKSLPVFARTNQLDILRQEVHQKDLCQ